MWKSKDARKYVDTALQSQLVAAQAAESKLDKQDQASIKRMFDCPQSHAGACTSWGHDCSAMLSDCTVTTLLSW